MTELHLVYVASIAGAILFFTAGAATIALRRARLAPVGADLARDAGADLARARDEVDALRAASAAREAEVAQLRHALAAARAADRAPVLDERTTVVERGLAAQQAATAAATAAADTRALRQRAERAEAELRALRERTDAEIAAARARAETELAALRERGDRGAAELAVARTREQQLHGELERVRGELAAAAATARAGVDAAVRTSADAEARAQRLAGELERARGEATAATQELAQAQQRTRDLERQLGERAQTVRDLSTENEQLKGRVRDAEAIHAEYVRLRTAATDAAFLASEVARLERELRELHIDALGGARPRPARGTPQAPSSSPRTIGDALASAIDRFADAGTRSVAVADAMGFPLASHGSDGIALAAYAAHLMDAAVRAKQLLPIATPRAIELVDEAGARVAVWTFDVDGDRLMLANLAVTPVDAARVEATLADLGAILAPTPHGGQRHTG